MSTKIVGIHQPNYIPWPGYFHKIVRSDVFVILDNVDFQQGNSSSITNRTRIKGANGEILLTVPVRKSIDKHLHAIQIENVQNWQKKHVKSIQIAYSRSSFFKELFPYFENLLLTPANNLADLNTRIIRALCEMLEINTPLVIASEMGLTEDGRNQRIVSICQKLGGDTYLCGKGGRKYMEEQVFANAGVAVEYTDYKPADYQQLHGDFVPGLSVLDPLMNIGIPGVQRLIGCAFL
jgi:hypothetical protein